MSATPRPWSVGIADALIYAGSRFVATCSVRDEYAARAECRANAELIVRAVNSHDELLDALKLTLNYWTSTGFAECERDCNCIVEAVRAAIAKAEGRTPLSSIDPQKADV